MRGCVVIFKVLGELGGGHTCRGGRGTGSKELYQIPSAEVFGLLLVKQSRTLKNMEHRQSWMKRKVRYRYRYQTQALVRKRPDGGQVYKIIEYFSGRVAEAAVRHIHLWWPRVQKLDPVSTIIAGDRRIRQQDA